MRMRVSGQPVEVKGRLTSATQPDQL
jgi:hypothetical protein